MASLLKILTDTPCDVYVDYELRGYAEPCKLLRLELRKGCYILEFKYKNIILESQDYIMPSNDEEALLKLSLADKYAAAQEVKKTLFYIATKKLYTGRLCPESNIATHYYNEADGTGSITFYESITKIQDRAFSGCTSLRSVTIPNSVTSIGVRAFYDCTSLRSVTIPNSVTSIGDGAFEGCTSLTSVTIPNSVTSVGRFAFSDCTSLISVTIPNSVTSIGDWTFSGCTSLTSVTIPNSVTLIGWLAFEGCTSLTSVTIPNSVTSIGDGAFHGCTSLQSVTIPDSVTEIADGAFHGCTSLQSVTIPDSVTEIADGAFCECGTNYVRYTRDYEVKGKYLFFDTETTGLPINYNAPTNDLSNWPRMVQLSWILTDNEGVTVSYGNFIIKPLGFVISDSAIKLHGITNEIANQDGVALQEVLAKFVEDVKNASCLVGHNVEFDKHIVGAELLRIGDEDIISFMTSICTMMSSIDYCKIINHYGYKYPKLQELYKKLFDEEFEDAHDASADVRATKRCFFELKRRNIINDNF